MIHSDGKLYIFGGQKLDDMSSSNDFYELDIKSKDISMIESQSCSPSARYGHSIDLIYNNHILIYGGLTMDLRFSNYNVLNRFRQIETDTNIHLFDFSDRQWSTISNVNLPQMAFHATTNVSLGDMSQLFLLGGLQKNQHTCSRLPLNEVYSLKFFNRDIHSPVFEKLIYEIDEPLYVSNHCSSFFKDKIIIFGGLRVQSPDDTPDPNGSAAWSIVNIFDQTIETETIHDFKSDYMTHGHSQICLSPDTLLVVGGTIKAMFLYSNKIMPLAPCALDSKCVINESEDVYSAKTIPWIQCDLCHKWIHKYCANIHKEPDIFHCKECLSFRSTARKSTRKMNN